MPKQSALAILAGIGCNFLAVPIDIALYAAGFYLPPPQGLDDRQAAVAFAYRLALAVLGGYVTARKAPSQPMKHALILAGIGVVLSTGGALAMQGMGPAWYPWLLVAICLPASWAGAKVAGANSKSP